MYLVSNNNVILDANCFFSANQRSHSLRQCYCYICAPTQTLSSLQWRSRRQQLDHRLTATAKRHRHSSISSLLRCMNQDSIQMHFVTGMNAVPHMTVSLTQP